MAKMRIQEISAEEVITAPGDETELTKREEAAAEELLKEEETIIASAAKQSQQSEPSEMSAESQKSKIDKKPKLGHKLRSKKYQEKAETFEKNRSYSLSEAVQTAKSASYSKFDGTFEIHINTNAKNLRGLISLPYASGKKLTILAFGKGAVDSEADMIGDDSTIADIQKGKLGFDVVITTPDWMPKLAKVAAILGPRGLMPNPKSGTITDNLKKTVSELQGGKTEYKTEKGGQVIHLGVGKTSQSTEELVQNIKVLLATIGKSRIKKVTFSPTMGPSVMLDLSSI